MHLFLSAEGLMDNVLVGEVLAGLIVAAVVAFGAWQRKRISRWWVGQREARAARAAALEEERRAAERDAELQRRSHLLAVREYLEGDVFPVLVRAGVAAGEQPGAVEKYRNPEGIRQALDRLLQADVKKTHTDKFGETVGEYRDAQKQGLLGHGDFADLGGVGEVSQAVGAQMRERLEALADPLEDHALQEHMRTLGSALDDDHWQRTSVPIGSTASAVTEMVDGLIRGRELMAGMDEMVSRAASDEPAAMQELARHRKYISDLVGKVVERLDRVDPKPMVIPDTNGPA